MVVGSIKTMTMATIPVEGRAFGPERKLNETWH